MDIRRLAIINIALTQDFMDSWINDPVEWMPLKSAVVWFFDDFLCPRCGTLLESLDDETAICLHNHLITEKDFE